MKTCFSGGEDLAQELSINKKARAADAGFSESDHPRDSNGKFGNGASKKKAAPSEPQRGTYAANRGINSPKAPEPQRGVYAAARAARGL